MVVRPSCWIGCAAVAIAAHPASADRRSAHLTLNGDLAATDNVFATTADRSESDLSITVRPGILLGYDAPRMSHELALQGEVLEYVAHSDSPSLAARLAARSSFIPSKYTTLVTSLAASNGVLSALAARATPDQTGLQVQPLGHVETVQGEGSVNFGYESGKSYTLTSGLFARGDRLRDTSSDPNFVPTTTKSLEAGGSLGVDISARRGDGFTIEAVVTALRLERQAPPTAMLGPRLNRELDPRLRVQWRHDWNQRWSTSVEGGAVYLYPYARDPNQPTVEPRRGVFPVIGGSLGYTELWGRAELSLRHDVAPDRLIAQNTIGDSATLSLTMPLRWLDRSQMREPRVVARGALAITRTQLDVLDPTPTLADSTFTAARIDIGLTYAPQPNYSYGLRYELFYQTGTDAAVMLIPGFYRNTLTFTFSLRYPNRVAGSQSLRRSRGVRADGADLLPLGVEPGGGGGGGGSGGDDDE